METTFFLVIPEPSRPEIFPIGGLHTFRRTGLSLIGTVTEPPIIHCDHPIYDVSRWGNGDRNISFISLESRPELRRGGIRWSSNDSIRINSHGTIGVKGLKSNE